MNQPLAYDGLRTVLQYMEPNLRCIISRRIPSISCAERAAPLKINKLGIESYGFVVNEHSYRFGTYRDYPSGTEIPIPHRYDNSEGGIPNDLDQYGFDDYSSNEVVSPGDLVVEGIEGKVERNGEIIEGELQHLEQVLARRLDPTVPQLNIDDVNVAMNVHPNEWLPIRTLKKLINLAHISLKPHYCRRDNTPPEFTKKIQFTASYPNGEQRIVRKAGDMKLHEPQKDLATILFGNRQGPIYVKHLNIECDYYCKILRLPQNFRLKVREISIAYKARPILNSVQPIIDESSYPLDLFETKSPTIDALTTPVVIAARSLSIDFNLSYFEGGWVGNLRALKNQRIHLLGGMFTPDDYANLVRAWIDNRREIGTCFTFGSKYEAHVTNTFSRIKEVFNGFDSGKGAVRIPMNDYAEIHVYYVSTPNKRPSSAQWLLTIEVVAV